MRHSHWMLLAALVAGAETLVSGARAQDMSFDMEDTGQAPPPPPAAAGAPSQTLENALRLYQEVEYEEAAVQFQRVVDGESQDDAGNKQKAQFFLGKTLYHLEYYQSSLTIFDEITQQASGHLYFTQSLEWLAQLAGKLPESAGIIEKVGRYSEADLETVKSGEGAKYYDQLLYMLGRAKYDQGEFEAANGLFEQVQKSSSWFAKAKMFEGISHVRMRQARPAIASFRAIIDAIEGGDTTVEEEDRLLDLAWLSLARMYYTAANKTDAETGEREVNGQFLGAAVDSWSRIGVGSEYWLDALFESSFAFFLADEFSRALGNIHTLYSPYFEDAYYPEALVLKAVVFFYNCQMDNAAAQVYKFHERYDPVKKQLEAELAKFEDNEAFFNYLQGVRAGTAETPPAIRGIVSTALSDRTVLRHLEYVRILEDEEKRLQNAPVAYKNSSVGARVMQDTAVAKSFAIEQAGDLARERYERLIEELQEYMNQIDAVDVEIVTFERGQLSAEMQEQQITAERAAGGRVEVDEEHQVWPFDGEYWRDELGFYRQQVTSQCGR